MANPLPLTDQNGEVRELTPADFQRLIPAADILPEIVGAAVAAEMLKPKGGRPRTETPKVFTGIRLDADVLDAFKRTGKGWQTRMNDALRNWLNEHSSSI